MSKIYYCTECESEICENEYEDNVCFWCEGGEVYRIVEDTTNWYKEWERD